MTRLQAGWRRGAGYGEPSNKAARAGAQRRQVLAEYGQGAAGVAAGAQGPLHHWQPWIPSIFLPQAGALARHTSSGSKGPALESFRRAAGRVLVWRVRAAPILFLRSRIVLTPLLSRPGREGATGSSCSFLGGVGGQTCWCSDCSRCRMRATASRVSVPRSPRPLLPPPLPRHESGFLPPHMGEPSSLFRSWVHPGPRHPYRLGRRCPSPGAAGSTEGWWLLTIGVAFYAVQSLAAWQSPYP